MAQFNIRLSLYCFLKLRIKCLREELQLLENFSLDEKTDRQKLVDAILQNPLLKAHLALYSAEEKSSSDNEAKSSPKINHKGLLLVHNVLDYLQAPKSKAQIAARIKQLKKMGELEVARLQKLAPELLSFGICHSWNACTGAMLDSGKLDWWWGALECIRDFPWKVPIPKPEEFKADSSATLEKLKKNIDDLDWMQFFGALERDITLPDADKNKPIKMIALFERLANYFIWHRPILHQTECKEFYPKELWSLSEGKAEAQKKLMGNHVEYCVPEGSPKKSKSFFEQQVLTFTELYLNLNEDVFAKHLCAVSGTDSVAYTRSDAAQLNLEHQFLVWYDTHYKLWVLSNSNNPDFYEGYDTKIAATLRIRALFKRFSIGIYVTTFEEKQEAKATPTNPLLKKENITEQQALVLLRDWTNSDFIGLDSRYLHGIRDPIIECLDVLGHIKTPAGKAEAANYRTPQNKTVAEFLGELITAPKKGALLTIAEEHSKYRRSIPPYFITLLELVAHSKNGARQIAQAFGVLYAFHGTVWKYVNLNCFGDCCNRDLVIGAFKQGLNQVSLPDLLKLAFEICQALTNEKSAFRGLCYERHAHCGNGFGKTKLWQGFVKASQEELLRRENAILQDPDLMTHSSFLRAVMTTVPARYDIRCKFLCPTPDKRSVFLAKIQRRLNPSTIEDKADSLPLLAASEFETDLEGQHDPSSPQAGLKFKSS